MRNKVDQEEVAMIVPHGSVNGPWTAIDNPSALGLIVPTLGTACTVAVQVARDAAGTGGSGLVSAGVPILALASGSGGVAISSNEMGALLAYPYVRVVLGAAQVGDVTFYLERTVAAVDNYG